SSTSSRCCLKLAPPMLVAAPPRMVGSSTMARPVRRAFCSRAISIPSSVARSLLGEPSRQTRRSLIMTLLPLPYTYETWAFSCRASQMRAAAGAMMARSRPFVPRVCSGNCLRRISAAEIFWKRSPCSFVRTRGTYRALEPGAPNDVGTVQEEVLGHAGHDRCGGHRHVLDVGPTGGGRGHVLSDDAGL